jgi:trans-aconitate methyltransferase
LNASVGSRHWDEAYASRGVEGVSWFEPEPRTSLELIEALGVASDAAVLDVGAGASLLADRLVERGLTDVTVVDVSAVVLERVRARLPSTTPVRLVHVDLLTWRPERLYDLWHDRAVLHFLVDEDARAAYLRTLRAALAPGAAVVVGTFAPDAPDRCSGLPVRRYSTNDLVEVLGTEFELVEARREEHVTPRGTVQPLTWVAGRLAGASGG